MNYYKMSENLHIISNNKDRPDINFWSEELYISSDFSDACLDVHLLLKKGICTCFESDEKQNEK